MRRRFFALVVALAAVLVATAPVAAITKNYRPDPDHVYVGLIAFYDSDWEFIHRCTGELLTPTIVLTAGHCPDDGTGSGEVAAHARIWVLQDVGSHYDAATEHDPVTGYPDSCTGTMGNGLGVWCAEADEMYNYGFDDFATFPNTHDAGLVALKQPLQLSRYAALAKAHTVDRLATKRGIQDVTVRVSGFGVSYLLDTRQNDRSISFRVRLQGDSTITNLHNQATLGFNIQAIGNGSRRAGTCSGDSGGPMFWPAGSDTVVAVTSFGNSNAGCRGNGYYYRTDRQPVIDWILDKAGAAADDIVIR
jgi:secreted trypsin-like serine protease